MRNGDTVIHPKSQEPRWFAWVDNMHDWCISRQLWWGHRIPIWYGPDGEVQCFGPDETAPEGWEQDPDVLDTWFSSGLWPFSTMGWPDKTPELEKFYPTSVLVTGYDILFFWVARMMMFGTYVADDDAVNGGKVPFKDLFLHGLVRDQFGKKMSKSRGNGIDPLDWVDRFGADALRFTLARGANPGADLSVGEDHAQSSRNFANKLFNATKFALMNGAVVSEIPARGDLTDADRWILDRLDQVRAEVDEAFEKFEFSKACEALYHFAWDEVCDWYLELAKVQFAEGDVRSAHTKAVLGTVLDQLLRMLHPVIPFVTETLWKVLTGGESLVIASWPVASGVPADADALRRVEDMQKLITEIRRFRSDQGLKPSQKVRGPARGDRRRRPRRPGSRGAVAGASHRSRGRIRSDGVHRGPSVPCDRHRRARHVGQHRHRSRESQRLRKDLAAAEKDLAATSGKLSNDAFLAKAPEPVVAKIRARKQVAEEEIARIDARLKELGQA